MIPNTRSLDFDLGETADMIRDTVSSFAQSEIAPRAAEIDRTDEFPRDLWPRMGELGLLGITVEEEWGGSGLGYLEHAVAMEEISRASASVGLSYGAHSNLCVNQMRRWGTDEQKRRYLTKLMTGEHLGSLAMSEPGAGSDVVSMKLNAVKKGDRYILNGSKMWITNGPSADTLIVYAKTDPDKNSRGITAFIIEKGFKGFRSRRSSTSSACAAPKPANWCSRIAKSRRKPVLAQQGGVEILMSGLDYERTVLAGGSDRHHAGLHGRRAALHPRAQAVRPGHRRVPAHAGQARRHVCDDERLQGLCVRRRQSLRPWPTARKDAAGAILFAAETATQLALDAIQLLGGNGYINDYPTGRLLRDAKLYEIGAGTSEIRRWLIGRELFAEST
jgi:isovaleryl-CoA dehydrogenase